MSQITKIRWYERIVTQAMALQIGIIAVVLVILSFGFAWTGQQALEEQYGLRAQSVAESVAETPDVRTLVTESEISPKLQEIAEAIRLRTGVTFVVITNTDGIRYSHPSPERIGKEVSTSPARALAGISDWYVEEGTLGVSVRGKVPIWDPTGENVVGIVSVGVLSGEVSQTLRDRLSGLLLAAGAALGAGAVAAYLGARRIRGQTLGLEPPEIGALYEHRDGLLRALHEGVLAVDSDSEVTLVNEGAVSMLGLNTASPGRLDDRQDLQLLLELAKKETSQVDVPVQICNQTLLVTCAPITIRNKRQGAVFTFRDRTELRGLVSELESAKELIDAMRAQAHEHSNSLHTISGLIELGRHEDVRSMISDRSMAQREIADLYDHRDGADSLLVASLLSKAVVAGERNVRLRTHLGELPKVEVRFSRDLVTIVGNLVDNAVDHLIDANLAGGEVEIAIWHQDGSIRIDVSDSGAGIEPVNLETIFLAGYTTKDTRSHDGLGLALVDEVIRNRGGTIRVDSEPGSGTLFSVSVPVDAKAGLISV